MFCENGNTALRIEPMYGSMLPRALHFRYSRAPLQKDVRSRLYEYDKNKKEYYKQERSAAGRVKETWYDFEGDIFRRDIAGRTVSLIKKDGRNRIETDEAGNKTRRDYDEWENLTKVIYPDNSEETMRYDPVYSNLLEKLDANGTVTRHDYDARGNLTQTTEAVGKPEQRVTTYTYDSYGQRLTAMRAADGVSAEVTRSSTYDEYGNEITKTDGEGNTTEFTYDVMGNVLTRKDPRGKLWTNTYDAVGKLISETDPLGHITQYAYDGVGNRIRITDAKGRVTQFLYNTQYRLVEIIGPTMAKTTFQYDPDGKPLKGLDSAGKLISISYDSSGRRKTITDGNGNLTELTYLTAPASGAGQIGTIVYPTFTQEFRYDNRGRKIRRINVLSAGKRLETRYAYDAVGNQTAVIDPLLRRTESSYDAYGRVTKTTDPAGGEMLLAYDNQNNLLSVTDPETNTTTYQYDRNNRQIQETRPAGGATRYGYNPTDKIATMTDAKGQQARYTYDDAGRMTTIAWYATAAATTPEKTVTLSYDEVGNLTGYNDGITSADYAYDANNRKIGETVNYGTFQKSLAYTYTANGLKASFTGPDGTVVRYGYDTNNQLKSVQIPVGTIITNRFDWVVSSAKEMKVINNKTISRAYCLHCGEKIPLLKRFSISIYRGVECPKCHSYITFSKKYFAFQIFIFLMLFPILALFERNKLLGFLGLLGLVSISFLVAYRAKYNKKWPPKKKRKEQ